ncbi:MAG TPA: macro domain-containing protein [Clostridium sp.]|nr:macro domain-containing protein [Clostridium sp.]
MFIYRIGDMFKSEADCLINTVNCEGYMGKGIAYQFKLLFPENYKDYIKACKTGHLRIGTLHYYKERGKVLINFPTKNKWRENSRIEYIEKGLNELVKLLPMLDVHTIAIPPLGCGNGGLEWSEVKGLIEKKLNVLSKKYTFILYEPSQYYSQVALSNPQMSVSSLVLMEIKMRLNKFNKMRLQKASFFTNIFYNDDYFKFDKYHYGPYAYSIDIISKKIKEFQSYYGLNETKDTYDMVYKIICSDKTNKTLEALSPAIKKATDYVNIIRSDKKLEGVSTILYLLQKYKELNSDNIIKEFKMWSKDKGDRFSAQYILDCTDYLLDTGIIEKGFFDNYRISEYKNVEII